MIHTPEGRTLNQGQVEFNRSVAWGVLKGIEEKSFEPYVAHEDLNGNDVPANLRQVMTESSIEKFVEGVASRYGVFFLTSSEVEITPVPLSAKTGELDG